MTQIAAQPGWHCGARSEDVTEDDEHGEAGSAPVIQGGPEKLSPSGDLPDKEEAAGRAPGQRAHSTGHFARHSGRSKLEPAGPDAQK